MEGALTILKKTGLLLKRTILELWLWLFSWIPTPAGMLLRLLAWRYLFNKCGFVRFGLGISLSDMRNISLGSGIRIGNNCFISASQGKLQIMNNVAISPNVNIGADNGEIFIGNYCAIGPGTVLRCANHNFADPELPICLQGHVPGRIVLEEDVWIGANCVITPDVFIGRGAIVGAGAVVTRDVSPYKIVAGIPAREIGSRKKAEREPDATCAIFY